jgi:lambda family phage minor tail protein L
MSRASNSKVNAELFSLEPTALLEFFVIHYDYVNRPDDKLYIHGGTNGIETSIYWQGQEYAPFPIQSSGFESKGDGSLPRPKLSVSNQDFFISNLVRRYNNLIGAKVVRKRTFVKFLDASNFSGGVHPYGSADSNAGLEDQVFFILRRSSETRAMVEFELASPLELENVNFPKRIVMSRYCSFHYRGNGCKYGGCPVADENDRRLSDSSDLRSGLLKRHYQGTVGTAGTAPNNTSDFISGISALTCSGGDSVVSTLSLTSADYYYTEFFGYIKIDKGMAGEYGFAVTADDSTELVIDGVVICGEYGAGGAQSSGPIAGWFGGSYKTNIFLTEGYHKVLYRHYEQTGSESILPYYLLPGGDIWTSIPTSLYYYDVTEYQSLTSSQSFTANLQLAKTISLADNSFSKTSNKIKWNTGVEYKIGDCIYIENFNIKVAKPDINTTPNWSPLEKYYVCVANHTSSASKSPFFNKTYWIADQCSKTLNGCKLRFGSGASLPFGGFPGTEEYSMG